MNVKDIDDQSGRRITSRPNMIFMCSTVMEQLHKQWSFEYLTVNIKDKDVDDLAEN